MYKYGASVPFCNVPGKSKLNGTRGSGLERVMGIAWDGEACFEHESTTLCVREWVEVAVSEQFESVRANTCVMG